MQLAFSGLSSWFEERATIVTSSRLLATAAAQQFAESHLANGRTVWERPLVLTLDAWLTSCWGEARFQEDTPALLSPWQEWLVWQQVIEDATPGLFDSDATAHLARRAANDVARWHVPLDHEAWNDHEDGAQFKRWYKAVRALCRERGWMLRFDLWRNMPRWVGTSWMSTSPVAFVGFDEVFPALAAVRSRLPRSAVFGTAEVYCGQGAGLKPRANILEEFEAAARWSRALIEGGDARSIAVFVPDLSSQRAAVGRVFADVLYPGSALRVDRSAGTSVFHLNSAAPLIDSPLIASALLFLELGEPRLDQAAATAILRSPYLKGASEERHERAQADLLLRRERDMDVSLGELKRAARHCPLLMQLLGDVEFTIRNKPAQQDLSGWSRFITRLLQATGWPGDAELDAEEQQAVEGWKNSLSTLTTLSLVTSPVDYGAALAHLRKLLMAGEAPETGDEFSPIQILDASDAAGLRFDASYVTGLGDATWPPRLPVSPLIPLRLQRACGIRGSSPAGLQDERVRMTTALFSAGAKTHASFSGTLAAIVEPFVSVAEDVEGSNATWSGLLPIESFKPATLQGVEDTKGPPFVVKGEARGGTGLIRAQSSCPFRGFAEIRLRAQSPEEACFGFDAMDRGKFLHEALQQVWAALKTQARLMQITESALRELIADAVSQSVADRQDGAFFTQTRSAERTRLEELIFEWLTTVERSRTIPFAVADMETELQFVLAGLPLRIRIDRVDRLNDGRLVLIDYKSGKQTKSKLDCPRPKEPQLLVYAAAKGADVDALFFGQLKPRDLQLIGISRNQHVKSRRIAVHNRKWDEEMEKSRLAVEAVAQDFLDGNAAVDPVKGACEWCGVTPLCRVNESRGHEEDCE